MHSPEWLRTYLALQGLLAPALDALWCCQRLPAPRVVFAELQRRLEAAGLTKQLVYSPDSLDVSISTCSVVYWRGQFAIFCELTKQNAPFNFETVRLRVHQADSPGDFATVWTGSTVLRNEWVFSRDKGTWTHLDTLVDGGSRRSAAWLSDLFADLSTVCKE